MDTITQLKNAIEFAKKNPDAPQSVQLRRRIESGMYNNELAEIKKGSFASQPTEKSKAVKTVEKVADFTGGKEIAQGLGQALAGNNKRVEETQNQQIALQGQLLQRIKEKKARGEDTSRLEGALEDLGVDIKAFGDNAEEILNPNQLTNKQVIGDALQLGTTVGTIGGLSGTGVKATGTLGKIPGLTKQAPGIAQQLASKVTGGGVGVLRGAGQGALVGAGQGAVSGSLLGTAQGLQKDKSVGDSLKEGLKTGAIGAAGGAVIGSVLGGISGGLAGRAERAQNKVLENITLKADELKPKEYARLLKQGRISPKTATSPAQYILSEQEKATALKYSKLINKDPVKTVSGIGDEIGRQDADVGNFLRQNNNIFNKGELKNALKNSLADVTDIEVDEKRIAKSKTTLINNFVDSLEKNNMENLWESRKAFDQNIEKLFNTTSKSLSKDMKIAFRNAVQDFISERTDDVTYKAAMKEMSSLFRLQDTAISKAVKEKSKSAIEVWIKNNPALAKILGIGAGAYAAKEFGLIGN